MSPAVRFGVYPVKVPAKQKAQMVQQMLTVLPVLDIIVEHMAFTVFESKSNQIGSPAVSVTPWFAMRLNKDASDILREAGATHVLILWDADNSRVGISSTPASDHRAYKLTYHPKGSGAGFAAKAFLRHIGWKATRSVPLKLTVRGGMLQADIPAEHVNVSGQSTPERKARKPLR
jgi:hypothetical protein